MDLSALDENECNEDGQANIHNATMSFILEALLHNKDMCEIKIRFRLSLLRQQNPTL